jgi:hypothetical protein
MRTPVLTLAVVLAIGLLSAPALLQQQPVSSNSQKGGEEETGPYEVVSNWPQPFARQGYIQGSQGGVFAESPNRIFIANRGEIKLPEKLPNNFNGAWGSFGSAATGQKPEMRNCIIVVDANGKLIESWTQWDKLFEGGRGPHAVKISPYDPERSVWVIDDLRQQIFKFSNDGKKLLMTLGEAGVAGNDEKHFGRPTDIAWLPDGTFLVSDGYTNTRVVKFDRNGQFLAMWGQKPSDPSKPGPNEFNTVHSIAIDKNRRVYVSDRGHSRIQVFDENGKFLDMWPNIRQPYHIAMSADQYLWIADGVTNKFLKYDLNGKLLYSWGTYGTFPGAFWGVHQFSVDTDGNLYAAETFGGRTQKYKPLAGADRARLMTPVPLMRKTSN